MSIIQRSAAASGVTTTGAATDHGAVPVAAPTAALRVLAVLRIALGWIFLWAFLDKTFALGFGTGINAKTGVITRFGDAAWLHGGSPTAGFLGHGTSGPLSGFYSSFAGAGWADALFMLGLLGIGLALILGIGMRIAAASGVAMLVMMWSAVLPTANNPFLDDHLVYAIALVALALAGAGRTFGLGARYERIGIVARHPFLR